MIDPDLVCDCLPDQRYQSIFQDNLRIPSLWLNCAWKTEENYKELKTTIILQPPSD